MPTDNDPRWVDADGKAWRVGDMSRSHRANALAFAERNRLGLYRRHLASLFEFIMHFDPDEGASDAIDELIVDLSALADPSHPDHTRVVVEAHRWFDGLEIIEVLRQQVAIDRAERTAAVVKRRTSPELFAVGWWEGPVDSWENLVNKGEL